MDLASELAPFSPSPERLSWAENRVGGLLEQVQTRATEIHWRDAKIEKLILELAYLRRMKFGVKSESLAAAERDLFDETLAADLAACEARLAEQRQAAEMGPHLPQPEKPKRERAGRQPLPEHLPRVEHRHEPESCTCGQCGQVLELIGEDVTEKLNLVPAEFFVERHLYPKYACRPCETITAAPAVASVIDGGLAAPALLAWVMVSKYADHLPLYRLERQAARSGVTLSRSTLADWVGRIGVALEPLWRRLAERLRQDGVLHADETPVQQLDPGQGKTKRAYLWAYRNNVLGSDPPIVVFDYQPGRGGKYAVAFLADWQGALMVDDFAGYQVLFRGEVIELACMAHARRKFFDLHQANGSPVAAEALRRIGELYAIEDAAKGKTVEERARRRKETSQPLLEALHLWLQNTRRSVADGSALARAIDYSLRRWPALARYATNGFYPIDNNPVENAIRPIAIGKKNGLFAGSEAAGQRAAAIQSLLETARLNGIEPMAWLTDTLEKLPTWPNSRIDELLPLKKPA
ncbi:MAG: IS66 family transposase [Candidatus Accumulibacter sp.]|nr:IS66 family transposase [Accumulibacter sp.]